jgi:hypothetical protein
MRRRRQAGVRGIDELGGGATARPGKGAGGRGVGTRLARGGCACLVPPPAAPESLGSPAQAAPPPTCRPPGTYVHGLLTRCITHAWCPCLRGWTEVEVGGRRAVRQRLRRARHHRSTANERRGEANRTSGESDPLTRE